MQYIDSLLVHTVHANSHILQEQQSVEVRDDTINTYNIAAFTFETLAKVRDGSGNTRRPSG
jgi:hypothetical protein